MIIEVSWSLINLGHFRQIFHLQKMTQALAKKELYCYLTQFINSNVEDNI